MYLYKTSEQVKVFYKKSNDYFIIIVEIDKLLIVFVEVVDNYDNRTISI